MTKQKFGIYAGSFDPITNGHWYLIEMGAKLFDELTVAVAVNSNKKCWFTPEERVAMIEASLGNFTNVTVEIMDPDLFLVNYAAQRGFDYILRGLRNQQDFEYEKSMRLINRDINQKVETVFLMPPREVAEISSSVVKSLVGLKDWEKIAKQYVTEPVFKALEKKHDEQTTSQ